MVLSPSQRSIRTVIWVPGMRSRGWTIVSSGVSGQVTATYRTNPDGSIAVLNRGFDSEKSEWREAEGVARFVQSPDVAHLKVSFFGPFYGSYIVFELGEDYDYAFVSGFNRDYLWLLARTPQISNTLREQFLATITELGFDPAGLVWPDSPAERVASSQ